MGQEASTLGRPIAEAQYKPSIEGRFGELKSCQLEPKRILGWPSGSVGLSSGRYTHEWSEATNIPRCCPSPAACSGTGCARYPKAGCPNRPEDPLAPSRTEVPNPDQSGSRPQGSSSPPSLGAPAAT